MNVFQITDHSGGKPRILLSILEPENHYQISLNPKCIVGHLCQFDAGLNSDNLIINPAFLEHFHKSINFFSQLSDHPIQLAEGQPDGLVYITDKRIPEDMTPGIEDIIGSYEVRGGTLLQGSYEANPRYRFLSVNGICTLQPELEALICATAY